LVRSKCGHRQHQDKDSNDVPIPRIVRSV
jgi:hypothetical protein